MRDMIKCSQCEMTFPEGISYRKHWVAQHFTGDLSKPPFHDTATANNISEKLRKGCKR